MSNYRFLIIDIGTGNVRVALTSTKGEILALERDDVHYKEDGRYAQALYFDPDQLWDQVSELARRVIQKTNGVTIKAITASSQREGIVLLDESGNSLIGLPNHDHRGHEWERTVENKDRIYELTGRYPTSLFSALKLKGIQQKRPEVWQKTDTFLSISDWAQYMLSGKACYEYSQASETQLFDVARKEWSEELASAFDVTVGSLPEAVPSETILGNILPNVARSWGLDEEIPVIVGGADTQLAIKSTRPLVGDIVIVSGTTTPVTKVLDDYKTDQQQRTWTNCDVDERRFILETNAGVTGLNYQRLKNIFYPNDEYQVIEEELADKEDSQCIASLGSLVAEEDQPLVRGGYVFDVPVSHQLSRADFAWATLWDIACSIKENYDTLSSISGSDSPYVWACSGGMQSSKLRQFLAALIGKPLRIRQGYWQASVAGGAWICREALQMGRLEDDESRIEEIQPQDTSHYIELYEQWKQAREEWKTF